MCRISEEVFGKKYKFYDDDGNYVAHIVKDWTSYWLYVCDKDLMPPEYRTIHAVNSIPATGINDIKGVEELALCLKLADNRKDYKIVTDNPEFMHIGTDGNIDRHYTPPKQHNFNVFIRKKNLGAVIKLLEHVQQDIDKGFGVPLH